MRDRIVGEEIEWTGGFFHEKEKKWYPVGSFFDKISELMRAEPEPKYNFKDGGFADNGARIYNESTGQHLETATPECSGAREVLKFDKWSERFVCQIAEKLKESVGEFVFYKKNSDSNLEQTRGCHENYFSDKKFQHLLNKNLDSQYNKLICPEVNYLTLFLITRQIFTGSGGIMLYSLKGSEKDIYEISPRTYFTDALLSTSSTTIGSCGRAIISVRNESLANAADVDNYFRNHFILGDANMADLLIFLKFGATSAVIEMIEEKFWDKSLILSDPFYANAILKNISKDLDLKTAFVRLKNGQNLTAIEVQKKFCKNWLHYLKYTDQGGEKLEIAERWSEVLDCLITDDEKLYSRLDWKIKMRLIDNFADKKGLPLNHPSIINIDNLYHSPDKKRSFYYMLKNRPGSKFESLVSDDEIRKADRTPPETRAKLRVYLKNLCDELALPYLISWDHISLRSGASGDCDDKIWMSDPRRPSLSLSDLAINAEAIRRLNSLKPNAILI